MRWTVPRRIVVGYAGSLVLVLLVATLGVVALRRTSAVYRAALIEERQVLQTAIMADFETRGAEISHLRYLVAPDQPYLWHRDSLLAEAHMLLRQLRDSAHDPDLRAVWVESLERLGRWEQASDSAIGLMRGGLVEEASDVHDRLVVPARDRQAKQIREGLARARASTDATALAADRADVSMRWLLAFGAFMTIGLGVLQTVLLSRSVRRPLEKTATILASNAGEILEATVQQTWNANRVAANVSEAVSHIDQAIGERRERDVQTVVSAVRRTLEGVRRAAEQNLKSTRYLEGIARNLNRQGMELLALVAAENGAASAAPETASPPVRRESETRAPGAVT